MAVLTKAGRTVLLPFGNNQRYNLAVDEDGKLIRVQCTTARINGNKMTFKTCSKNRESYRGQIEAFGVFCPENGKVYFVPVDEVPESGATLNLEFAEKFTKELPWVAEIAA